MPADEREVDDRDTSVSRLLAVTLLPGLGMYAAFGQVADAADRLFTQQVVRYGIVSDQIVQAVLSRVVTQHPFRFLGLIVGLYLVRRLLDYLRERTGLRALSLVVVLTEAFFLLVVILGGIKVFQTFSLWLGDRVLARWWDVVAGGVHAGLSALARGLPRC